MQLATYLAQVSLYWLLLYSCYGLVLCRHTFFAWNRAYLLGSLLGAFALPLVTYPEVAQPVPVPRIVYEMAALPMETIPVVVETQYAVSLPSVPAAAPFPWVEVLWAIYALGVVVMAIRLFMHVRQVGAFIRQGTSLDMDAYRLCLLDNDRAGSFSFLNHIVVNRTDYAQNFDTVLSHELAHVRRRHSWDILLVEVLRVLFWFNPVLILYKKSLQQVHEYLADREVCAWEAVPRDRYAEFMVNYALGTPVAVLANPFFNSSLLKDRIMMLYKNKNSNWSLGKYAAVALLVGVVSLLAASCEQKANEKSGTEESAAVADQFLIIEGTVVNTDGTPLPGAEINVKGSQTGTTTTTQGQFRIRVPADSELDFSFVSHKTASVQVKQQGTIEVTLAGTKADAASVARWVSSDTGNVFAQRVKTELLPNYVTDSVYTVVAENPEFPGGIKAMYNFIQNVMKYPAPARRANVEGKVFLTFVVNADGSIQNIKVLKGLGFACDEEAIRVVSAMPKWIPGEKANGEKVNVKYNLPISFVLPEKENELSADLPFQMLQQVRVKGVVVDADNKPLTHTVVKTSNGRTSFLADQLGEYEFSVPTGSELVFYSTRHKMVKVKVDKDHIINAVLAHSNAVDPSVVNMYEYVHEEHKDAAGLGERKFIPKIMPKEDSSGIKEWKLYWLGKND